MPSEAAANDRGRAGKNSGRLALEGIIYLLTLGDIFFEE